MGRLCCSAVQVLSFLALGTVAAGIAAGATVEIVSPKEGAELRGKTQVVATVVPRPGEKLDQIVVQTSRGEWLRMSPQFADTHAATLDTTKLRNGRQAILVVAAASGRDESLLHADSERSRRSQLRNWTAEVQVVVSNPYQFYWGNLHVHTSYSDGAGLPKDAYEYARDKAHVDFCSVTDHSQMLTFEEYQDVIAQAESCNQAGRFVALYAVESREVRGRVSCYMSPTPCLPVKPDDLYRAMGEMGLLGHFTYSSLVGPVGEVGTGDFQQRHYSPWADRSMASVQVRNAGEEALYIKLLDAGWHVGAVGGQDQHERMRGATASSWTVALARELTREAILEALSSRRTYSAGDRNLQLTLSVDGEDMGSQIARPAGMLNCLVTVADPDESEVIDRIDLLVDGRIVQTARPKLAKYAWAVPVEFGVGKHYCFVRVTQPGDHMTWSSPIWVSAY